MSGSFFSRKLDQVVHFKDPESMFPVDGKVETVRLFVPDEGDRQIVLTAWFDYRVWKQIERNQTFGFEFGNLALADGQAFQIESWKPIQVELRAEAPVEELLVKAEGEALLDEAVAGLTGSDEASPLRNTTNYKFLGVYQEQEMDGKTFLKGADSVFKK